MQKAGLIFTGAQAAAKGLTLSHNPHDPGSADYFRWLADWHRERESVSRAAGRTKEANGFRAMADQYFDRLIELQRTEGAA